MQYPGTGIVLTSDSFFYFAGQLLLWSVVVCGALWLMAASLPRGRRVIVGLALVFAFASSFGPLFVRWALSMPGLGGIDAGGEEFWLSFSATCPQTIAFALLLWAALRSTQAVGKTGAPHGNGPASA